MISNRRAAWLAALRLFVVVLVCLAGLHWYRHQRQPDYRVDQRVRLEPATVIPWRPSLRMGGEVRHAWRLRANQPVRFPVVVPGEDAALRFSEGTLEGLPQLRVRVVRPDGSHTGGTVFEATEGAWHRRWIPLSVEPGEAMDVELTVLDGRGRPGLGAVFVADLVLESAGRPVDETAVPILTRKVVRDLLSDPGDDLQAAPASEDQVRVGLPGPLCVPLGRARPWRAELAAVPVGSRLTAVLHVAPAAAGVVPGEGQVELRTENGEVLATLPLGGHPATARDDVLFVDLADRAGRPLDLIFERRGGENLFVGVRDLFVTAPLAVARRPFHADRSVNVVLILVDGLRADRLGCFGYASGHTPGIDALAARGGRYGAVWAPSSWSLPNVATLLTGLAPASHGLGLAQGRVLSERVVTMARSAAWAGFSTAAFVSSPDLARSSGLESGYETFVALGLPATVLMEHALDWLEEARQFEWFLTLHFGDPVDPVSPFPGDLLEVERELDPALVERLRRYDGGPGRAEALALEIGPIYDAEIAGVDRAIRALLSRLEERDLLERTLVVVMGSAGQELGERGGRGRAQTLHQEVLRVPLVLAGPGVVAAGEAPWKVDGPIEMVDVTRLLGHLGQLIAGSALQGRLPQPFGPPPLDEPVLPAILRPFAGVTEQDLDACRRGDRLLLMDRRASARELLDLSSDPPTRLDLRDDPAAQADADALDRALRAWHRAGLQAVASHPVPRPKPTP